MLRTSGLAVCLPAHPVHLTSLADRTVSHRALHKRSLSRTWSSLQPPPTVPTRCTPPQSSPAKQLAWQSAVAAALALPCSASAADINYTPGQGADVVKNIGGLAYVGLLGFWLFKVVGRRIKRSTSERLASQQDKAVEEVDVADVPVSVGAAFLGAAQASFFTYLLFLFSNSISGYFSQQGLPDNYTARNMSVTFRTAIAGLAYLATFIFGANAAGLTGLTIKLLISPDDKPVPAKDAAKQSGDKTSS